MYLDYEKLKPFKFELNEAETDYFINLYNNTIKDIQKEKINLNWFQKLYKKNNEIPFYKVKDSSLTVDILNKYMKKNKDIIFDKSRFNKIKIGTINQDNYESCLDSSLLCHKLIIFVENTRTFIMDTEVLFTQDDGTIFKQRHYFDAGEAILLRPHNVITPIYGEVENDNESESDNENDDNDADSESEDDENVSESDTDKEESENEKKSESDEDNYEYKEEFVDNNREEESHKDEDEDNIKKFGKNTIRYITIDITDKEGGFKMDRRYFY